MKFRITNEENLNNLLLNVHGDTLKGMSKDEDRSIEEIMVNAQMELPDVLIDLGLLVAANVVEEVQ